MQVVKKAPLAICDMNTVKPSHVLSYDKVHVDRVREGPYVLYDALQSWYRMPDQRLDEALIFKIWDSGDEGVSG